MTRAPKKTKDEEPAPTDPAKKKEGGQEERSYYYDDAHGYQDYESDEECGDGDEGDEDADQPLPRG